MTVAPYTRRAGVALLCVVVLLLACWIARPAIAGFLYKADYKELAYQCDNAMHDDAAIRSYDTTAQKSRELRTSADVQLLVCHEYDKLRKRMLLLGVSEDRLALYALESIEIEMVPLERMVDPHRMPRF